MKTYLSILITAMLFISCGQSENSSTTVPGDDFPTTKKLTIRLNTNATLRNQDSSSMVEINKDQPVDIDIDQRDTFYISIVDQTTEDIIIYDAFKLKKLSVYLNTKRLQCEPDNKAGLYVASFKGTTNTTGQKILDLSDGAACLPDSVSKTFTCSYQSRNACLRSLLFVLSDQHKIGIGIQNIRDVTISEIVLDDGAPVGGSKPE